MTFEPTTPMTLEQIRERCIRQMTLATHNERFRLRKPKRGDGWRRMLYQGEFVMAAQFLGYSIDDAVRIFHNSVYRTCPQCRTGNVPEITDDLYKCPCGCLFTGAEAWNPNETAAA